LIYLEWLHKAFNVLPPAFYAAGNARHGFDAVAVSR